jgi:SWI/SNF-related matrix-associated actin-dependent regulator of chromatin subfamily A-like protein 1
MPHQIKGGAFLAERGFGIVLDPPGLGKTATTIIAADMVNARRVLVCCPAVVRNHWSREFASWQQIDRPITVMEGWLKEAPGDGVTIISHAVLADSMPLPGELRTVRPGGGQSLLHLRKGAPYDAIIFDELHMARSPDSIRARNLWFPDGVWSWAHHFWGLTGTPMVGSAADLWMMNLGPLRRPDIEWFSWCQQFCEMKPHSYEGQVPFGIKNEEALAAYLRPHVLRRTFASVGIDLPPLTINHLSRPINPALLNQAMAGLENWTPQRLASAIEENDDLRDAAISRVRRALGIAKAEAVAEHIGSIIAGGQGPVVAFFQHTDVRNLLHAELSTKYGYRVSWIDGKVNPKQIGLAEAWLQNGWLDVLLVQTDAGGVGLTLTRSNRVVIAELPWTAVALHQAIKRCHRISQQRDVTAEVLKVSGCWLEDSLASVVSRKAVAAEKLLTLLET